MAEDYGHPDWPQAGTIPQEPVVPAVQAEAPLAPNVEPCLLLQSPSPDDGSDSLTACRIDAATQAKIIARAVNGQLEVTLQSIIAEQMQQSTTLILDELRKQFSELGRQEVVPLFSQCPSDMSSDGEGRPAEQHFFDMQPTPRSRMPGQSPNVPGLDPSPSFPQQQPRAVSTPDKSWSLEGFREGRGSHGQAPAPKDSRREDSWREVRRKKQRMRFETLEDKRIRDLFRAACIFPHPSKRAQAQHGRIFPVLPGSGSPRDEQAENIVPSNLNENVDETAETLKKRVPALADENLLVGDANPRDSTEAMPRSHSNENEDVPAGSCWQERADACDQPCTSRASGDSSPRSPQGWSGSRRRNSKLCALRDRRQSELISTIKDGATQAEKHGEEEMKSCHRTFYVKLGCFLTRQLLCLTGVQDVSSSIVCSLAFQAVVLLSGCFSSVACIWTQGSASHSQHHKADIALSAGAVLGLLACACFRLNRRFVEIDAVLVEFAEQKEFAKELRLRQSRDACLIAIFWLVAMVARLREVPFSMQLDKQEDVHGIVSLAVFAISSGLLMALLFSFLRICLSCQMMIDDFASAVVHIAEFRTAMEEWNVLHALLRASGASVQYLFVVLQTTIVATVTLGAIDLYGSSEHWTVFVAPAVVLVAMAQIFLRASLLTDNCERMPSFVNSLCVEQACYRGKTDLVEYISYSRAGFYMFEVRLTSGMVLKAFYVLCVGLFALLTKVIWRDEHMDA